MWNDATVCGGIFCLNIYVSVWSDMWNSCERDSAMMFSVPLICCEYKYILLLTSVQPIHQATALCDSAFNGSKYALYIQPSALELSMNAKMCDPCISCRVVMYMFTAGARNYRSFNVNLTCHIEGIIHRHARPLLL